MKAVILAGGIGSRLSEETSLRPKPMVEIGGRPILWHVMKIYSSHGINDFIICCGYKGYLIKEYFANYFLHSSDVTINVRENKMQLHNTAAEPWSVTLIDTGQDSQTGGRLKRVRRFLDDSPFCFTYGDGVGDVDISALIAFHQSHGRKATITGVQPSGRYGALVVEGNRVRSFMEKPKGDGAWINGGFFVLDPSVIDFIEGDSTIWEYGPLETLAKQDQLSVFLHRGFWLPMDTLRDKNTLEALWTSGEAPWKTWE